MVSQAVTVTPELLSAKVWRFGPMATSSRTLILGVGATMVCFSWRPRRGFRRRSGTTNNRKEPTAAAMALETLDRPCQMALHADSDT